MTAALTIERVGAVVCRVFERIKATFDTRLLLVHEQKGTLQMAKKFASEELLAAPLPELVKNLGLAVAVANKELRTNKEDDELRYTINEAKIRLKIAINVNTSETGQVDAKLGISAFSMNASYARTYGFKEEASSEIELSLSALPPGGAKT
jgi:hypothetical protein